MKSDSEPSNLGYWITQKNNSIQKAIEAESPSLKQKFHLKYAESGTSGSRSY